MINYIKNKLKNYLISSLSIREKVLIPVYQGSLLNGRKAIITGGSTGIGYAIASAFLRNGAKIVITGRNEERLKSAKKKLICETDCSSDNIECLVFDISEYTITKKILESYLDKSHDPINILVNNAGINIGNLFPYTDESDFDKVINTNLKGVYFLSQIVASYMIRNNIRGNILNLASSSSLRPVTSAYTISKWGIRGLTLGMAKKLVKNEIIVNGIAPGPTTTSMLNKENTNNLFLYSSPSKRFATPEEIANWAVFLVSEMGKMIVGDVIYITGGAGLITYDDIGY